MLRREENIAHGGSFVVRWSAPFPIRSSPSSLAVISPGFCQVRRRRTSYWRSDCPPGGLAWRRPISAIDCHRAPDPPENGFLAILHGNQQSDGGARNYRHIAAPSSLN